MESPVRRATRQAAPPSPEGVIAKVDRERARDRAARRSLPYRVTLVAPRQPTSIFAVPLSSSRPGNLFRNHTPASTWEKARIQTAADKPSPRKQDEPNQSGWARKVTRQPPARYRRRRRSAISATPPPNAINATEVGSGIGASVTSLKVVPTLRLSKKAG